MAKEWIDIADTAIKIGLGSIITGFFTYIGMRLSHTNNQNKFMLEHKTKVLEKIADDVDFYFSCWNGVISRIAGTTRNMNHDDENIELTSSQYESIKGKDRRLVESWAQRQSSISRLRLLKAESASKKLTNAFKLEAELRESMFFDRKYLNYNEISEYREDVKNIQKEFQIELANFYEKLSA